MTTSAKQKHVLVTGGAGFIGSHLCERLLALGHRVTCLDNFHTGSRSNVAALLEKENFELVHHDVVYPFHLAVDEIYNLACPASPIHYQYDPIQTTKTNVLGTLNMLELAKRLRVPMIQASTSEVYGDALMHPQSEAYWGNVNPNGYRACYNEGKRCAETLALDFHRQYRLPIKIARIFNTYGPRMQCNDGRVVSNFIVQALKAEPISMYGDGSHTRSLCYIDDLVDALLRLADTAKGFTGPINLGNPNELSIADLAQKILQLTGSLSTIYYYPLPPDDPVKRKPDILLAKETLQWWPTTDLDSGLKRTIDYFRKTIHSL